MRRFRKKKFYRLNQYIQARELRVIDEEGKQIGIMPREQALLQAQNQGLDLVEVASKARPPVCKIIDFKKFKYLEGKKKPIKKGKSEIKEIRLSPFIAKKDFENRITKARKFLKSRNQVKITVLFRGREISKKEFGYQLLKQITEKLNDCSQISQEPKFIGYRLTTFLNPYEKKNQKTKTENKKINQKKV